MEMRSGRPIRRATLPGPGAADRDRDTDTESEAEAQVNMNAHDPMEVLAQALAGLNRPERFKTPSFNGEGDVELFLEQFQDVAIANG